MRVNYVVYPHNRKATSKSRSAALIRSSMNSFAIVFIVISLYPSVSAAIEGTPGSVMGELSMNWPFLAFAAVLIVYANFVHPKIAKRKIEKILANTTENDA